MVKRKRTFEFLWNVLGSDLPTPARMMLVACALHADDDGAFFTTRQTLMAETGMNESSAKRWMAWLEGRGQKNIKTPPPSPPIVTKTGGYRGAACIRRIGGAISPPCGGAISPGEGGLNARKRGGYKLPRRREEYKEEEMEEGRPLTHEQWDPYWMTIHTPVGELVEGFDPGVVQRFRARVEQQREQ